MSKLRPECGRGTGPVPPNETAYLLIYTAVQHQTGLIHGHLHQGGWPCAIGSFFDDNPKLCLYDPIVDEVAMVNDSVPHYTPQKRKAYVARWLRWKLQQLGMPLVGRKVQKL
jgi:hypothetical protein